MSNIPSTERHRFLLAMLFIGGFLIIMGVALVGSFTASFTGLENLATVFSGWITAVIGFYFLQSNTEKAQEQATVAITQADNARKAAQSASKCIPLLAAANEANIEDLKAALQTYEGKMKEKDALIQALLERLESVANQLE